MTPISPQEIDRILANSPLFAALGEAERHAIAGKLKREHWPRHSLVMTPTDTIHRFYVLLKGRVKITRQNPDSGREITLFLLGPGDGFNVISLFDGQRHDVTAETLDQVEAVSGPIELWIEWLEGSLPFRHAMRRYVDQQMRQLSELASDLVLHDTMTRLVHLILRYFNTNDKTDLSKVNLIKDLPHGELAHMIGTVRVVVNRLIRELKREGILDTQGGSLRVCDLEKLLKKAEDDVKSGGSGNLS